MLSATIIRKAERLGREWADHHHAIPGKPEPLPYGNLHHDRACAARWLELTGTFPSWYSAQYATPQPCDQQPRPY